MVATLVLTLLKRFSKQDILQLMIKLITSCFDDSNKKTTVVQHQSNMQTIWKWHDTMCIFLDSLKIKLKFESNKSDFILTCKSNY